MKYFRMSYEEVVFNRSYINIMLLNRSIPVYDDKSKDDKIHNEDVEMPSDQRKICENGRIHASDYFMQLM